MDKETLEWITNQVGPAPEWNPWAENQDAEVAKWQIWSIKRLFVGELRVAAGFDTHEEPEK